MKSNRLLRASLLASTLAVAAMAQEGWSSPKDSGKYPPAWDVRVAGKSLLAEIKTRYQQRTPTLPPADLEDRAPLPAWFRAYLRDIFPGLPTSGPYQYPWAGVQILEWMVAHPDLRPPPAALAEAQLRSTLSIDGNINITNRSDERNNESSIAIDPSNARVLIAAANNIEGSGRQKQFSSDNSGFNWKATELDLHGANFHTDPSVAFASDGTAWATAVAFTGSSLEVQVHKSTDHGQTWSYVRTVSNPGVNDRAMLWIDSYADSPRKDNIYIVWTQLTQDRTAYLGLRFVRATEQGSNWSPVRDLSHDPGIGAHLATGPSGQLYVAWPHTETGELKLTRSTDGGENFTAPSVIATTNGREDFAIPAMCVRRAQIYLSIGVDRSAGPNRGTVYATWADRDESAPTVSCSMYVNADASSSVYFSKWKDCEGCTGPWSEKKVIHKNDALTDQFNPWMDIDPVDGSVHVAFQDTRDDPSRKKSHVYYVASRDGGDTWGDETRLTTADTDETDVGTGPHNAHSTQYGDYNGLAVRDGKVFASWTDRRADVAGARGSEQIYTNSAWSVLLPLCTLNPGLCTEPIKMGPGKLDLRCRHRPCVIVDPLPKNCLVKFKCPVCGRDALCPSFYRITLEGLKADWKVGLFGPAGDPVPHEIAQTRNGLLLIFRPEQAARRGGGIDDYFLTFELEKAGKVGAVYHIETSLDVSDKP
jgi:hypothetical protein